MSWLVPKLRFKIQIQKIVQGANSSTGGFDREYETMATVYAGINNIISVQNNISYIRGNNIEDAPTHEFIIRYSSIKNFGKKFTSGFSIGFDSIEDFNPIKTDYFIFLNMGSSLKGRLFQIISTRRDEERKEWFNIKAKEIEELGIGYVS